MIVIFYPQFYGVHGIARYLDSFLSNLPEDHSGVILITGDEFKMERQYDRVEILHLPLTKSRFSLISWAWSARKLLRSIIDTRNISSINFHFPPLIPGFFLPKNIPIVLTAHSTYRGMFSAFYKNGEFDNLSNFFGLKLKMLVEKIIFSKASHVITLTEYGKSQVRSYNYNGPITVIPNGVDLDRFTPDDSVGKDIDVLFCGRVEKLKGSRSMVDICKELIKVKKNIKIIIVGHGDDFQYVYDELKKFPNNVEMVGKIPFEKITEFYNRSKLYASTSYYEGLPGTCLEALAMKLPAVVWDYKFYDPLVMDGVNGKLIPPGQSSVMVEEINRLLLNPDKIKTMGVSGREFLELNYSWSLLSRNILKVMAS